ncbi:MAG: Colanic acid biosynthesis acetyltransferase WcaF [Marmoricola sp.]|nr:Colanic acid biosynthesis acetyltransferase WcaF [Marmoricola sp.]
MSRVIRLDPDDPDALPNRWERAWAHLGILLYNNLITYQPFQWVRINTLRLFGASIGQRTHILRGTTVIDIHGLEIGSECSIGFRCLLDGRATVGRYRHRTRGLTIGNRVVIASDTHFLPGFHDPSTFEGLRAPTLVEDYVWIATRCTIEGGVVLGRGAVVGNSTLVRKDVPSMAMVAGIPAKVIGTRESDLTYDTFWRPWFQ